MAGAANAGEVRARLVLDSSNFRQNMQQAQNDMESFKSKSSTIKDGVEKVGKGAEVLGGSVVAIVGASVAAAANFQQSMSRLQAMSGASADQMTQLQNTAKEWGAKTKYSATEAADAMTNLSMAGFTVQQSMDALPGVLSMAAAGNLDLSNAAEIAGNAMNIFGLQAKDLGHVSDVLALAANTSNADITDLAESLKYTGPVAKGLGISFEETTAALALMSNAGIKGSDAGTSLRASLLSLASPVGQAAHEIKNLHLNVKDASGSLLPLPQLIDNIQGSFKGMTDSQKTAAAAALVGREAASGFITLINAGSSGLNKFSESLINSNGAAQKMASTMQDNLKGAWENFTGSLENDGITIGQKFLPILQAIVNKGTDFLNVLGDVNPELFTTGAAIAGTASALALFGVGIFKAVESFKAMTLLLTTNPWAIAITGVALLGGAIAGYVVHQQQASKVSLDTYNALNKQQTATQNTINSYDTLKSKLKLSNDEMLTYLDLNAQLQDTTDPERIKTLSGAMDLLQQKSGLSKSQMQQLVQANKDLITIAPGTQSAISKTGQQFALSSSAAKELNDTLRQQKQIELELQAAKVDANLTSHVQAYQKAQVDVNNAIQQRNEKLTLIYRIQAQLDQLDQRELNAQSLKGKAKTDELNTISAMRNIDEAQLGTAKQQYVAALDVYQQRMKSKQAADDTLNKDKEVYAQLNQNILASVGLTAAQGQENQAIKQAISNEEEKKQKIIDQAGGIGHLNAAQADTIKQIQDQIQKYEDAGGAISDNTAKQHTTNRAIDDGRDKAQNMQTVLTEGAAKKIKFTGDGLTEAQRIQDELSKPVQKVVNVVQRVAQAVQGFFQSTGDDGANLQRHSGGTLPKYHVGGSPAFDQPKNNEIDVRLLRNEMVLTEEQQSNLFRMIKNSDLAAYAFLNAINDKGNLGSSQQQPTQINVAQLHVREEADVKKVAIELDRLAQQRQRFRG